MKPRVALLVTCLINVVRPQVGKAAVQLLEEVGCQVSVPTSQTCCGQPNLNSGDNVQARAVARHMVRTFVGYDYVVGASGSCVATLRRDYPLLLAQESCASEAEAVAEKTYELFTFLMMQGWQPKQPTAPALPPLRAAYHDSCSGLRQLGIRPQPRGLLSFLPSLTVLDFPEADTCCGFGGTFCVKYPEISAAMADDKVAQLSTLKADLLLGGDLGCLMHMAGRLARRKLPVRVYHAAEMLAGMAHPADRFPPLSA